MTARPAIRHEKTARPQECLGPYTVPGIFPLPWHPLNRGTGRQTGPLGGFVPVFAAASPAEEC